MTDDALREREAAMLFVPIETWKKIRVRFSEDEKTKLNVAIRGEVICPPGVTVDGEMLGIALASKLAAALKEAK